MSSVVLVHFTGMAAWLASPELQNDMEHVAVLDAVVVQGELMHPLAGENQLLLVRRDPLLFLDLDSHVLDCGAGCQPADLEFLTGQSSH